MQNWKNVIVIAFPRNLKRYSSLHDFVTHLKIVHTK